MKLDAERVKQIYNKLPGHYASELAPAAPGSIRYYRKQAVDLVHKLMFDWNQVREDGFAACDLSASSSVLLLCVGTASDLVTITARTGPNVNLVGIDFSSLMLDTARELCTRNGWTNVELLEADASQPLPFDTRFDLTCCVYGFSVIPDWQGAYDNLVRHAKIGGKVLVTDCHVGYGWRALLNPAAIALTKPFGGTSQGLQNFKRVVDRMKGELGDVRTDVRPFSGFAIGTRTR